MGIVVVTAPQEEPVSLDEAKLHLRVDVTDDDALILGLVKAAREHVEAVTRRALVAQTIALTLDGWPSTREIALPRPPLQSVTSVTYTDAQGQPHELSPDAYIVDASAEPGRIVLQDDASWPSDDLAPAGAVTVTYVAGYGDASDVPQAIVQAMLLLVGWWYEQREGATVGQVAREAPLAVDALLWPYRFFGEVEDASR